MVYFCLKNTTKSGRKMDRTIARERIGLSVKKPNMSCGGIYLSNRLFFLFYILLFKTFLFPNSRRKSKTHKGKKYRGLLRKVIKIQPILPPSAFTLNPKLHHRHQMEARATQETVNHAEHGVQARRLTGDEEANLNRKQSLLVGFFFS